MGININPAQLDKVKQVLTVLASKNWLGELAQRISAAGMKLVADGFKTETDPYGKKWAPLAGERSRDKRARLRAQASGKKVKGQKILQDTGRMRGSVGASPIGNTARLVIPTWYAEVHQNGGQVAPHSRLAAPQSFLVSGRQWRFISSRQAEAHNKLGSKALAKRGWAYVRTKMVTRTFANGIRIPQRMMLPEEGKLPGHWQKAFMAESELLFAQKTGVRE